MRSGGRSTCKSIWRPSYFAIGVRACGTKCVRWIARSTTACCVVSQTRCSGHSSFLRSGGAPGTDGGSVSRSVLLRARRAFRSAPLSLCQRRRTTIAGLVDLLPRSSPRRTAFRFQARPRDKNKTPVGVSGEFIADFLARNRNVLTSFVTSTGERTRASLEDAVTHWVDYLGVGSRVVVEDQGKLGRSLLLEVDGKERDLTAVGVGASQLLPVVAIVLRGAPRRSVVLLEQPELHLHPAVQSQLADFLMGARPDLRVVVETHSEYLVSRVRTRVAQRRISQRRICLLFSHRADGTTKIRNLELGPLGDLDSWPKGFFDTSEREAGDLVGGRPRPPRSERMTVTLLLDPGLLLPPAAPTTAWRDFWTRLLGWSSDGRVKIGQASHICIFGTYAELGYPQGELDVYPPELRREYRQAIDRILGSVLSGPPQSRLGVRC